MSKRNKIEHLISHKAVEMQRKIIVTLRLGEKKQLKICH
jgi:hypothetical protein